MLRTIDEYGRAPILWCTLYYTGTQFNDFRPASLFPAHVFVCDGTERQNLRHELAMVDFGVRMTQKTKSPVGLIRDFFNAVEKQDIIAIQDKVLSLIQGSIHIARQKLQTLKL